MASKFEVATDLHIRQQVKLTALLAKQTLLGNTGLTADELAFINALAPYALNRIIRWDTKDILSAQQPNPTDNPNILEAEGNTVPVGYPGFKQGAIFHDLNLPGRNTYINVGTATSAQWVGVGDQGATIPASSPSASVSPSASSSPSQSPSSSMSPSASVSPSASASASLSPSSSS